ncbi:hypothetical protein SLA2020_228020 [Shorea laevis]
MALKNSPAIQSESRGKERRRKTTKVRSSKCKAEISCSALSPQHVFADSNAIQIGGEEDIQGAQKKRYQKVAKRKRPISVLEIEIANTALKKMEAKVKEEKEETSLMKNNLAETKTMIEEMESVLNELKGGVYAMRNWMQIT